ncbi:GyrI-like domain-containing protein [Chryseomicrobium palamuruense]|uniref:GyrI-like domain-containing protein n=1 Tax=Chryseomicrobium palamuruense TaxID=682973 RepID=A0ABV8UYG7_9BACL
MPAHQTLTLRAVVTRHQGLFTDYATIVPEKAQQFMKRLQEVDHHASIEVAIFEPHRGDDHTEGHFFVGTLVSKQPDHPPAGMEYMEFTRDFAYSRGTIEDIGTLHLQLNDWMQQEKLVFDYSGYIVEMYFPTETGEEVEIYLPVKNTSS